MIGGPYTALEFGNVGFVVLGDPESVDEMLVCARELGVGLCGFVTEAGLFGVDARVDWVLVPVVQDGEG
jgi:hypothetical protein